MISSYCIRIAKVKINLCIRTVSSGSSLDSPFTYAFYNIDTLLEIVKEFCYLGVVFTTGDQTLKHKKTLSGQAMKAVFTLNKYLYNFLPLKPSHMLELFDKSVTPILNYGSEC